MVKFKRPVIRALRTFLQAFLGILVGSPIFNMDVSVLKSAIAAGVGAVISLVQNALEDNTSVEVPKG